MVIFNSIQRSTKARFFPGAHVFPGGVTEKSDYDNSWFDLIGPELQRSTKIKMIPEEPSAVSTGIENPGG